jgi:hypothetical protein
MEPISYTKQEFGVDVKVNDVRVKLAYQRPIIPSRLRKLVNSFDPLLVGEVLIVREDDGTLTVIDGQHRVETLKGRGQETVKAEVLEGVSNEDRGRLFLGRNDRSGVSRVDRDRSLATVGDEDTLAIDAAAQAAGFVFIAEHAHESTFRDAAAGRAIIHAGQRAQTRTDKAGGEHLADVLSLYAVIYGNDARPESLLLKGLSSLVLSRQETELDRGRLGQVLRGIPPQQVVTNARAMQIEASRNESIGMARAMKRYLVDLYNRGLPADSTKRLRY